MFKPSLEESINWETRSNNGGLLTKGYYLYIDVSGLLEIPIWEGADVK